MKYAVPLTLALTLMVAPLAATAGGPLAPTVELQPVAPMVFAAPVTDWTGFYSGVSLGFGNSYGSVAGNGGKMKIAGVNLGYRQSYGKLVFGGEFSYDKDNVGKSTAGSGSAIRNTTAIKLIAGTSAGPVLLYGTLGAAHVNASLGGVSGNANGYTAGIGADYALNDQWTLGGELSAARYNDFNNSGVDLKNTQFKLKLGYRF